MNRNVSEMEKLEVMQHNRKVRMNNMRNQVKVNNYLSMNNQERFKNVCLGYSIQAERLLKKLQEYTAGDISKEWISEERKSAIEHISSLMRKVQTELIKLEDMQKKYNRHIHNSIYCKSVMKPYVKHLEQIIAETDALVKGQRMNGNIEVINENLWAVNMQYVKEGYIEELQLIPNTQIGQINLSNAGRIILDSGSRAYPALKKLFLIYMQKPTDELMEIMKMPKRDSLDGLCENVVGWEIKRRCVMAEYMKSRPKAAFKNKLKQKIKQLLERR